MLKNAARFLCVSSYSFLRIANVRGLKCKLFLANIAFADKTLEDLQRCEGLDRNFDDDPKGKCKCGDLSTSRYALRSR